MAARRIQQLVLVLFLIFQIKAQSLSDYVFRPVSTLLNGVSGINNQFQSQFNNFDDRNSNSNSGSEYSKISGSSCENYWRIQRDFSFGSYGTLTIPNPDKSKNILKVTLSLAAQLPSVK